MTLNVTVIIPAYNAASTIADAVYSAANQSLAPKEIIVIDDGSHDDTARCAAAAGARVISTENAGVSVARNRGIAEAQGEWIAFLDADDRWLPERLARQAAGLQLVPEAHFVFSDMRREREGRIVEPRWMLDRPVYQATPKYHVHPQVMAFDGPVLAKSILKENFIPTSSVLVARTAIPRGGFNARLRYCEDLELWLRILAGHDAIAIEESLIVYRLHLSSVSAQWKEILYGDIVLYEQILKNPLGYSAGLAGEARALLAPRKRVLGTHLLRTETYGPAFRILAESFQRRPSLRTFLWLALAMILGLPFIKRLHHYLRTRKNSDENTP